MFFNSCFAFSLFPIFLLFWGFSYIQTESICENSDEKGIRNAKLHSQMIINSFEKSQFLADTIKNKLDFPKSNSVSANYEIVPPFYWSGKGEEVMINNLNRTLREIFSKTRNEQVDITYKDTVRQMIMGRFAYYSLQTQIQHFEVRNNFNSIIKGANLVGVMPGSNYHQPGDSILVVGAHYDTTNLTPGVNDNGSGMTALLETVRVLASRSGELNNTVIFVGFDQEEKGCLGSMAFVNQFLIPRELKKYNSSFTGAFIMDMVLNFDPTANVQRLPRDMRRLPEVEKFLRQHKFSGNFLAAIGRRGFDNRLWDSFNRSWNLATAIYPQHKLLHFDPPIPRFLTGISSFRYRNFLRSDHTAFWNHKNPNYTGVLPAILLTDTGPYRGIQLSCYHEFCDDLNQLTLENLHFLKHTTDILISAILGLSSY